MPFFLIDFSVLVDDFSISLRYFLLKISALLNYRAGLRALEPLEGGLGKSRALFCLCWPEAGPCAMLAGHGEASFPHLHRH